MCIRAFKHNDIFALSNFGFLRASFSSFLALLHFTLKPSCNMSFKHAALAFSPNQINASSLNIQRCTVNARKNVKLEQSLYIASSFKFKYELHSYYFQWLTFDGIWFSLNVVSQMLSKDVPSGKMLSNLSSLLFLFTMFVPNDNYPVY